MFTCCECSSDTASARSTCGLRQDDPADVWTNRTLRGSRSSSRGRRDVGGGAPKGPMAPLSGGALQPAVHIETAVFVDRDLVQHMALNFPIDTEREVVRFVLAMVNAVSDLSS